MGTLKTIMDNNEGHMADNGGVVSPSGISYIGRSLGELGRAAAVAVKRINLDYRWGIIILIHGNNRSDEFSNTWMILED